MKESTIETYLRERVELADGLCEKFTSTRRGVPDRLITHCGQMYLVELKRPGGKPRAEQARDHLRRALRGVRVYVIDSEEAVDAFMRQLIL